jgi:hypothetical protein
MAVVGFHFYWASGEFKGNPTLVYYSENPRALQGIVKLKLPVIKISNRKSSLTTTVFEKWFTKYFCIAVKSYCTAKQQPKEALLILNNAPAHPT